MSTTMVTGGGSGLGAVFARRLAAAGDDLILVGRDPARLEASAVDLRRRHGVRVEALTADLAVPEQLSAVADRLRDPHRPVEMLVNNAGSPSGGPLLEMDIAEIDEQVAVNITAVLHLTRAALPSMLSRGHGRVVNVASFAGYFPMTGSSYGPTKAWVLAFTDSVARSLVGTDVAVIALCAGRIVTGRNEASGHRGSRIGPWLDPDHVVSTCLADLARGRTLSTPGLVYRAAVAVLEMPRRSVRLSARLVRKRPPRMQRRS